MKPFLLVGSLFLSFALSACGAEDKQNHNDHTMSDDEVPEMLMVELTVPEKGKTGEEVEFVAMVTQGEEIVEDADEVKFEVLNKSTGEKEMIDGTLNKDKNYSISYTFKQAGIFDITSHVTARNMHTMPTKTIEVTGEEEANSSTETASHSEVVEHHGHGATIEFKDGTATVGEAVMLTATISLSESPLEEARVQYEIARINDDYHHWIEAPEKEAGKYQSEFTFTESGTYEVQVHVTKGDDIHDHIVKTYIVK
ncbi:MAG: FixH family protein [Paenisporosarcina sp.]